MEPNAPTIPADSEACLFSARRYGDSPGVTAFNSPLPANELKIANRELRSDQGH